MTDVEEAVPAAIDDKGLVQPDEALELDETIHSEEGSNSAGEVVAEKATKRRKKRQEQRHFSRRLVILTALLVLIMIGAVCGIVVVFLGGNDSDSDSDASTGVDSSPSTPPAPSTPVSTPTPSPVVSSSPPVESPTASPTNTALLNALLPLSGDRLDEPTSPQYRAYQWMATEDPLTTPTTSESELQQRYAMATMYFSLTGAETSSELPSFLSGLECFWPTAACGGHNVTTEESWRVTEFRGARQSFEGTIPPEIGLLESLVHLDLGDNMIKGSLPDEIYLLSNLKNLYLENNAMTGSLSESIGSLPLLENVYLAKNEFTGSIPGALRSRGEIIMPLRKLCVNVSRGTRFQSNHILSCSHICFTQCLETFRLPESPSQSVYRDHSCQSKTAQIVLHGSLLQPILRNTSRRHG